MSEHPNVDIEQVTLRVVTPMFLGRVPEDRLGHPVPELRPPSIKGALRFWHRATGPQALRTEAKTFGSTSGRGVGQAPFLLQLMRPGFTSGVPQRDDWDNQGLRYLAYGMFTTGDQRKENIGPRRYISENTPISLRLVFKPTIAPEIRNNVMRALRLLTYFGGLGARSRRGFGSVILPDCLPDTVQQLQQQVAAELRPILANNRDEDMPRYTMFGSGTRVVIVPGADTPLRSLVQVGGALSSFRTKRGWGEGAVPQWLKDDIRLISTYSRQGTADRAPHRAAFGLPHNYDNLAYDPHVTKVFVGDDIRRASPLFMHVHCIGDRGRPRFPVILTFMPAVFFPNKKPSERRVPIKGADSRLPERKVPPPEDFHVVDEFLDHVKNSLGAQEVTLQNGA